MTKKVPTLRVPGRKFERLLERAQRVTATNDEYEMDLALACAKARVVRRGRGLQAFIPLEPDQMDRIADWFPKADQENVRRAADALRKEIEDAPA